MAAFRQRGAQLVAMEASSHALVQDRLAGVPVSVAVFTNLSRDHLDYHGDMDRYFAAKAKLFARPELQYAVINNADPRGYQLAATLAEKMPVITFAGDDATVRCSDWQAVESGIDCQLEIAGQSLRCHVPVYGQFNLENVMAVAGVLHGMNYSAADIARGLEAITPVPGRMQIVPGKGPRVLVDYAHTPDGLDKALTAARMHFSGRLWCVVGCGGNRDAGKRPQMAAVAERLADQLVFTSDNPRYEEPQSILADMLAGVEDADRVQVLADRKAAISSAIADAADTDVVLVAGKGHEAWQEIRGEKIPMDDCQLAASALLQREAP